MKNVGLLVLLCALLWNFQPAAADEDVAPDHTDPLLAWRICGPTTADTVAQLEPGDFWRDWHATSSNQPSRVELAVPKEAGASYFARTSIWSDGEQTRTLLVEADGACSFFLNDAAVLQDEDGLTFELRNGWNDLLLKTDGAFACGLQGGNDPEAGQLRFDPFRTATVGPAHAIELFDGSTLNEWMHHDGSDASWLIRDGVAEVIPGSGSIETRKHFRDFSLHVEFRVPANTTALATGQSRSNSGVYIHGSYEVQILDSYGQEPQINSCASLYRARAANVNASSRPGQWNSYDIEFVAPRFDDEGKKISNARVTVLHNGVLVHRDVQLEGPTGAGWPEQDGAGPIVLQDHGDKVAFRNVWIVDHQTWEGSEADGFDDITPDASMTGWTRRGGAATYEITAADEVLGLTKSGQPNTFLCTDKMYEDFVLEFEVLLDEKLNSGVQIRSNHHPDYRSDRVHGYQVELDPSDRAWSTGIYDESRRGWLHSLEPHPAAREAYRHEQWNRVRVYARNHVLRTWINDVPAAVLIDGMTSRGFFGLQVHGGSFPDGPHEVRWRGLRVRQLSD